MNDRQLRAEYQGLRETERRAAPDFRNPTVETARKRTGDYFPRARMISAAAAMLVAVVVVTLVSVRDSTGPEPDWSVLPFQDETLQLSALEMPTDFLLDSRWSEVELSEPEFDFEFQELEFPEDPSDAN